MTVPEATTIILVRHAHHDPGDRFRQHSCTGLTDRGRDQAERLAARLRDHDLGVDTILTSRAVRTIETAAPVAGALGITPDEPTCDLCEMHPGAAEGLTVAEMNQRWGPNYAAVPGGQYFPDWLPGARRRLRLLAEEHHGRTVLAVTHSGVVRASFTAFGGMSKRDASAVDIDNTGLTIWTRPARPGDPRRRGWSLARHNDTAHLEQA